MIHIADKWYLDADTYNVILYQKQTTKTGENAGKDYFREDCYPRDLKQALDTLTEKKVKMAVSESNNLKQLIKAVDEIHKDIKEFCKKNEDRIIKELKGDK